MIKHFGATKAYVAGHDWGAAVAWALVSLYPQVVILHVSVSICVRACACVYLICVRVYVCACKSCVCVCVSVCLMCVRVYVCVSYVCLMCACAAGTKVCIYSMYYFSINK